MNDQEPKPKCCSDCVHFQKIIGGQGDCDAPVPWWVQISNLNRKILLPEEMASECSCYLPKL